MRNPKKKSPSYVLKTLLAGGIAGCAAKTSVAPLDRVKILFQTNNPTFTPYAGSMRGLITATGIIWKTGGSRGLFRGHTATLLRIFPYAAIKFMAYEQFRAILMPDPKKETVLLQFLAGSLAGMTSVIITYPLELIRVRMAYNAHDGFIATCKRIWSPPDSANVSMTKTSRNFYRGVFPTLVGMIPYAGVSFATHYLMLKTIRAKLIVDQDPNNRLPVWAELVAGGVAGAVGQTSSYPLEVVRRRMQVADLQQDSVPRIKKVIQNIWREKGMRGYFVGLSIGYIKVIPMVAISFTVYDQMKHLLKID